MLCQATIGHEFTLAGIGLHSGGESRITVQPAPIYTGIQFRSMANGTQVGMRAHYSHLIDTSRAVTLGNGVFCVQTIEHFMAAFYAFGVSNAVVILDGCEMPILDGSSKLIVEALEKAGVRRQNALQETFRIPYPIWVEGQGSYLVALPADDFRVTYTIDFTAKSAAVGAQTAHYVINSETFTRSIAPARTFGFAEELDHMRKNKLALGGSMNNALVFDRDGLLNGDLRFENECVRHKVLDLIGDLSLTGYRLACHVIAFKAGHAMDLALARKIDAVRRRKRSARATPGRFSARREHILAGYKTD